MQAILYKSSNFDKLFCVIVEIPFQFQSCIFRILFDLSKPIISGDRYGVGSVGEWECRIRFKILVLDITGERILWTNFNDLTWLGGSKRFFLCVFFYLNKYDKY